MRFAMKYIVLATAAEKSGAKQVVLDFYNYARENQNNDFFIITGKISLNDQPNIKTKQLKWVKNSYFHRLFFEQFYLRSLIHSFSPNRLISLQNLTVPLLRIEQEVYINQAIPFSDYKIKFLKSPRFWFYKNIYGYLILLSCKQAKKIIVQANWLKNHFIKIGINESKIIVEYPNSNFPANSFKGLNTTKINFVYPTSNEIYKNVKVILDAMELLAEERLKSICLTLTIQALNENLEIEYPKLHKQGVISLIGFISRDELLAQYQTSVLIFPSLIETFGYPLIEARIVGSPIIAADLEYARDVLNGYDKVDFINPYNASELSSKIDDFISFYKYNS
jgi:glycosyltransferase involved in cell wall biosynthesis